MKCSNIGKGSRSLFLQPSAPLVSRAWPSQTYFTDETSAQLAVLTFLLDMCFHWRVVCVRERERKTEGALSIDETHMQSLDFSTHIKPLEHHKCTHTRSHKGLLSQQAAGLLC